MHVLVATRETQGRCDGDVSWTVDGELVRLPLGEPTGLFTGLSSAAVTTTAMVVDSDMVDHVAFRTAIRDTLLREGHLVDGDAAGEAHAAEYALGHMLAAALFPVGTVLELREGRLHPRVRAPSG
jgi:hypothetical protein